MTLEAQISMLKEEIRRLRHDTSDEEDVQPNQKPSIGNEHDSGIVTIRGSNDQSRTPKARKRTDEIQRQSKSEAHGGARPKFPSTSTPAPFDRQFDEFETPVLHSEEMPKLSKITFSDQSMAEKGDTPRSGIRSIKLANFDGTGEWRDYKSHFDACARINGWN